MGSGSTSGFLLVDVGRTLMVSGVMERGFESCDFRCLPLGGVRSKERIHVVGNGARLGPHCSNQKGWSSFATYKTQHQTSWNTWMPQKMQTAKI